MSVFDFRLQRVLDLRQRAEQESAIRLASARQAAIVAQDAHASVLRARAEVRAQASHETHEAGGCAVGQLLLLDSMAERLDELAEKTSDEVHQADAVVAVSTTEFTAAVRDRRALDRLEERHHTAWDQAQVAQDRRAMDAIALTRFVRHHRGNGGR